MYKTKIKEDNSIKVIKKLSQVKIKIKYIHIFFY